MSNIKKFRIKSFKNESTVLRLEKLSLKYDRKIILDNLNLQLNEENQTKITQNQKTGRIEVSRLDPFVPSGNWTLEVLGSNRILIQEDISEFETVRKISDGRIDLGFGSPVFEIHPGSEPFVRGQTFRFQCFRSSTLEVYSPSMIEKAKSDEMSPPYEVRVGGIIEVPWQGFHSEILIGTNRFMQTMKNEAKSIDPSYLAEVCELMKERATFIKDIWESSQFFFHPPSDYDEKTKRKKWNDNTPQILNSIISLFSSMSDFNAEQIETQFK